MITRIVLLVFFISAGVALAFNFPNVNPLDGSGLLIAGTCGNESCLGIGTNNPSAKLTIIDDFRVDTFSNQIVYTNDLTSPSAAISTGTFSPTYANSKAFDSNGNFLNTCAAGSVSAGNTLSIGQDFGLNNSQSIRRVIVNSFFNGSCAILNPFIARLQYSDDNSSWADALPVVDINIPVNTYSSNSTNPINPVTKEYADNGAHQYWRFKSTSGTNTIRANDIQMIAGSIPIYEALTIKNNRKVGINQPDPDGYQLEVVGDANVSGQVIVGDEVCFGGNCNDAWAVSGNPTSGTMVSAFTTSWHLSNCTGATYGGGGSCPSGTSPVNSACFPDVPGNIGTKVTYCLKN